MTIETMQAIWSFIKADCIGMIKHYWTNGILPHDTKAGVMKMVPKKAEKQQIKDR